MKEIAREEEREGNRVWIGYGKIRINEQWWRWDESEEILRNGRGEARRVVRGEGKEESIK